MKLSLLLPTAAALLATGVSADQRRLGAQSSKFGEVKELVKPFMGQMNLQAATALAMNDPHEFLDAVVESYTHEHYFHDGKRALNEEEKIIDTPALLSTNPANDVVTRPGVADLDEWLLSKEWKTFTSDIGKHEQRDAGNVEIKYVKVQSEGNKGVMLLSVGNSEPVLKYSEIIYDMMTEGYTVYAMDHRGQGFSTRLIDDHFKNHVENAVDYPADFAKFVRIVKKESAGKKMYLTCHSMGCGIALAHLLNEYNAGEDTTFNAVVAFAPLVKADTSPFPYSVAVGIGATMQILGLETSYAPTKEGDFLDNYHNGNFNGATTQSVQRWTKSRDRCVTYKDKKIGPDNHVGLCLGGVTGGKAKEFFDLYDAFAEFMEGEGKISTPILIQTAGDMSGSDGLVLNPETKKFCDQSLKSCTLTNYPTSKHHIWTETDDIRNPAMKEAFDFFARNAGVKTAQCPTVPTCGAWNYSWRNWGCKNSDKCEYKYKFGDVHLGQSCRAKPINC